MVINIWEDIIKNKNRLSKKMDIISAIVNVLDRVFDDMKDEENRLYTEQLMSEEFVKELREELIGMMKQGDGVRVSEITQFFKHKYKGYLYS